jgi:cation diffusion facilitator family transporter
MAPDRLKKAQKSTLISVVANALLAIIKIVTGFIGHSYALVADGIESIADIFSSLVVLGGLRIATKPADDNHPYGHGKAEPLAAVVVALGLLAAAVVIAIQSIREISTPHHSPEPYTLIVLILVILVKELLFRMQFRVGTSVDSTSVKVDAWHHRSDALTSVAAFLGISIALIAGPGYESADDWFALLACLVIVYNAGRLLKSSLAGIMDEAPEPEYEEKVRALASAVPNVSHIEKIRIRKSGLYYFVEIHVTVDGLLSVNEGHRIGHEVKDKLCAADMHVSDVLVHIEPEQLYETRET